jgi:hypothetical protein
MRQPGGQVQSTSQTETFSSKKPLVVVVTNNAIDPLFPHPKQDANQALPTVHLLLSVAQPKSLHPVA